MRVEIHNKLARFRVNEDLIALAMDKAHQDGMTLSEFIRAAIRREVKG